MSQELPWRCPDHPNAQIRHEWNETHHSHVLNHERITFAKTRDGHQYFCNECGRELAAPEKATDHA